MIKGIGISVPTAASYAGGKVIDRLYPENSEDAAYKSRFQSFREVLKDTVKKEYPALLRKTGLSDDPSKKDNFNVEIKGFLITIPPEHMKVLQKLPAETKQEKLYKTFNAPTAKELTGSLVNIFA